MVKNIRVSASGYNSDNELCNVYLFDEESKQHYRAVATKYGWILCYNNQGQWDYIDKTCNEYETIEQCMRVLENT